MNKKEKNELLKKVNKHISENYPNNTISPFSRMEYTISTIDFEGQVLSLFGRFTTKDIPTLKKLSNKINSNPFTGKHNWHLAHKGVEVENAYKLIVSFLERIDREKI